MIDSVKRVASWLPILGALALLSGCASSMPERLREARTGSYVFHHSAADVESAARALLLDEGFHLTASLHDGVVATKWRPLIDDDDFASTFERYTIVIQRLSPEHCRITAIKMSASTLGMETAHPHNTSKNEGVGRNENTKTYGKGKDPLPMGPPSIRRDLDLEWKLISREEPARARIVLSDIDWQLAHR